jgi:hypothetical protein
MDQKTIKVYAISLWCIMFKDRVDKKYVLSYPKGIA